MSNIIDSVNKQIIVIFNQNNLDIKKKILSNTDDKLNVNKLRKLDKNDRENLRKLANIKISEYKFDENFNINNYNNDKVLIDTLAKYIVKKRSIIYYIYNLYLSSIDTLHESLSNLSSLKNDYDNLKNKHQNDTDLTTNQLKILSDKHNNLLKSLRDSVVGIDNEKTNTNSTGTSLADEKKLKSTMSQSDINTSNISSSLSKVIKNGNFLRDKISELKSYNDMSQSESNKKLKEAQNEIDNLKNNIENYRNLLKSSWPVLAATLTQDELNNIKNTK